MECKDCPRNVKGMIKRLDKAEKEVIRLRETIQAAANYRINGGGDWDFLVGVLVKSLKDVGDEDQGES